MQVSMNIEIILININLKKKKRLGLGVVLYFFLEHWLNQNELGVGLSATIFAFLSGDNITLQV